jgi:hypothetical protein
MNISIRAMHKRSFVASPKGTTWCSVGKTADIRQVSSICSYGRPVDSGGVGTTGRYIKHVSIMTTGLSLFNYVTTRQ